MSPDNHNNNLKGNNQHKPKENKMNLMKSKISYLSINSQKQN